MPFLSVAARAKKTEQRPEHRITSPTGLVRACARSRLARLPSDESLGRGLRAGMISEFSRVDGGREQGTRQSSLRIWEGNATGPLCRVGARGRSQTRGVKWDGNSERRDSCKLACTNNEQILPLEIARFFCERTQTRPNEFLSTEWLGDDTIHALLFSPPTVRSSDPFFPSDRLAASLHTPAH